MTAVLKTVDQTAVSSSIALVDDAELQMSLLASGVYWFEAGIRIASDSVAQDFKFTFDGPSGVAPSGATAEWGHETLNSATPAWIAPLTSGAPTSLNQLGTTASVGTSSTPTTAQGFIAKGLITMGGNAGTILLRWCQNTAATATLIVKKFSFIRFQKLN